MTQACAHCSRGEVSLLSCVCGEAAYCGRECQRLDWPRHKPSCPPYVLKDCDLKEKGQGLFATRNLPAYTVLMVTPVRVGDNQDLMIPVKKPANDTEAKIQDRKLKQLEASDSVNHSCNANCAWRPEEGNISTLMTLVSVQKGEELTVNYYFLEYCYENEKFCLPYEERKRKVAELYGFVCLCKECSQGGKDDHLRMQYKKHDIDIEKGFRDLEELEIESIFGLFEIAEAKLKLGRKLDNQVLSRDLMHCLPLLMCLMNVAPEPMASEYREQFDGMNEELQKALKMYPEKWCKKIREELDSELDFFK